VIPASKSTSRQNATRLSAQSQLRQKKSIGKLHQYRPPCTKFKDLPINAQAPMPQPGGPNSTLDLAETALVVRFCLPTVEWSARRKSFNDPLPSYAFSSCHLELCRDSANDIKVVLASEHQAEPSERSRGLLVTSSRGLFRLVGPIGRSIHGT
jgi:hypothetical protein